ncbi:ubiquitin carboxyl-terminal hydrolase 42-like [Passerculus sandwichensis]
MDWQQRQRPGAGLFNLGNTCYINVILQCLTYTPPLANYLLSYQHSQSCHQQGFCMMCTMESHVRKVLSSSATAILPGAVLRDLKFIGEEFEYGRQENAYEFLRCTLDAMHRACLSCHLDVSSEETTIVHQIFGGFMKYRVTCLSCQAVVDSYKAFLDVSLDIKAASSLTTVLEDCVTPKQLDQTECFRCSKCKKKAAASKKVTVHRAPRVLTLCLERADQWTGTKISKFVEYPEYLDLRPYMSDTAGEPLLCSLYAIVVHSGDTCLEGHFLCYAKASNGLWYKMDDESVDNCDIHTVLGQQAYLLFYARVPSVEAYEAAMVLSGVGDALGYRGARWEYCTSGPQIHGELAELGGLAAISLEPPEWPVSDDTVLHLATAEGLATVLEALWGSVPFPTFLGVVQ